MGRRMLQGAIGPQRANCYKGQTANGYKRGQTVIVVCRLPKDQPVPTTIET